MLWKPSRPIASPEKICLKNIRKISPGKYPQPSSLLNCQGGKSEVHYLNLYIKHIPDNRQFYTRIQMVIHLTLVHINSQC